MRSRVRRITSASSTAIPSGLQGPSIPSPRSLYRSFDAWVSHVVTNRPIFAIFLGEGTRPVNERVSLPVFLQGLG